MVHFFTAQETDEAGRVATRLQKILLTILFLHILSQIIFIVLIYTGNYHLQYVTYFISFSIFVGVWLLGFLGSLKRSTTALLIFNILLIIWLMFIIVLFVFVVLAVFTGAALYVGAGSGAGYLSANAYINQVNIHAATGYVSPQYISYASGIHINANLPHPNNGTNNGNVTDNGHDNANNVNGPLLMTSLIFNGCMSLFNVCLWIMALKCSMRMRRMLLQINYPQYYHQHHPVEVAYAPAPVYTYAPAPAPAAYYPPPPNNPPYDSKV